MKIGILTFHCAHNYGAVLQAYGLQEYLKSCGHEVEIIDYRPTYLTNAYEAFPLPDLRKISLLRKCKRLAYWCATLPWRLRAFPVRVRRRRGFEKFIGEKLNLSLERFKEGGRVPAEKYDVIFFGSDQIWSPNHTHGADSVFFGDFLSPAGTRKIAYAASAGAASETLGENEFVVNALKNFDAISVRESNLAASLQPHTDLKIETVLDPTLLADKSVWEKLADPPKTQKKYVLVYQVSYNPEADRIAKELAAQIGAEVISVWAGYSLRGNMLKTETPEQFVGWFKNAACVVSTSFHGTAFGLIFEKPLYYVGRGSAAENRPKQILGALGLMNRYIAGTDPAPKFETIDYDSVAVKMGGGYTGPSRPFPRLYRTRAGALNDNENAHASRSFTTDFCRGEGLGEVLFVHPVYMGRAA
ncbi:MAG: polysaccharide pyruvyl transferase family protein [Opitutales bacterium]|nr:polysaccharide pyruvyl transferase family protein [Opitutales bacterium]